VSVATIGGTKSTAIKGNTGMNRQEEITELGRLRNRHVAKLLDFIGATPPYLEMAVKRSFSMFAEDVEANIINSDSRGKSDVREDIRVDV
jgi:hypothetical protein